MRSLDYNYNMDGINGGASGARIGLKRISSMSQDVQEEPIPIRRVQTCVNSLNNEENCTSGLRSNRSMNDLCKAAVKSKISQKDVVDVFAEMLTRIALANDKIVETTKLHPATRIFQGKTIPKVSMKWYLWRIVYYLNRFPRVESTYFAEDEENTVSADHSPGRQVDVNEESETLSRGLRALLLALVYIDRITTRCPDFLITSLSLHRVVLTAVLCATKFTDDFPLGVDVFARLGGISSFDMSRMELRMCSLISFQFHLTEAEFDSKCMHQLRLAFDLAELQKQKHEAP
mmetsp:Transcript_1442/g.2015  ORF Transcript_1442/g.2015 Transcript_1442/m.2015 type:complete len:289 (+) Transcript_1442:623-1489(+)